MIKPPNPLKIGLVQEFRDFLIKQNALALAVGVVIGDGRQLGRQVRRDLPGRVQHGVPDGVRVAPQEQQLGGVAVDELLPQAGGVRVGLGGRGPAKAEGGMGTPRREGAGTCDSVASPVKRIRVFVARAPGRGIRLGGIEPQQKPG
jgi:hypothetical protein